MPYPKHVEEIELKIKTLDQDIARTRRRIDQATKVLDKHQSAKNNKKGDYDEFDSLVAADPKAAEELDAKKKLTVSKDRVSNKESEIADIRSQLNDLLAQRKALAKEKVAFVNYDPLQEHLKDPAIKEAMKEFKTTKVLRKSNSKFTTLEALFARPEHRVVAKPEGKFGLTPLDQLPLELVTMDPDLIPAWLLEEFGIAQIPANASALAVLQAKVEAMPKIRELFKKSSPLGIQREGAEQPWLNHRLLAVQGMGEEHDGKILYSRYHGKAEEKSDRKMLQVFHSAYDSHRKTDHADKRYQEETPKILLAEFRIQGIHQELLEIRKGDPDAAAKKEAIRLRLIEELQPLRHATNVHKRSAFDSLLASVQLKDSMGRDNLGAACARLLRALGQIRHRRPQIYKRSQFGHADQQTLDEAIGKGESYLSEYRVAAKAMVQKMPCLKSNPVFNGSPKGIGNQADAVTVALVGPLRSMMTRSDFPAVRPFNLYGQKLEKILDAIQFTIRLQKTDTQDKFALTSMEVSKAFHLMQLFDFQKRIERLIKEVSLNSALDFNSLTAKAVALENVVLKPEIPLSGVSAPYQAAHAVVAKMALGLVRGLRHYSDKKLSGEETSQRRLSLKAYLESVDFPSILATLD